MSNDWADEIMNNIAIYMKAESKALQDKDIETGTVELECPLCRNKAIGNRYEHRGSRCAKCGIIRS